MKTYLSIDLDYWERKSARNMSQFVRKALSLNVPTMLAREHHWILGHVNSSGARRLINVDHHDDIVARTPKTFLNCASWVSYVRWRKKGVYEWRYPWIHCGNHHRVGVCDEAYELFGKDKPKTEWQSVSRGYGLRQVPWESIVRVGIVVSPGYWSWRKPANRKILTYLFGIPALNDHWVEKANYRILLPVVDRPSRQV